MRDSGRIGDRERLYGHAAETLGAALGRLARAYERDADQRRDLLQEIHVALWRSLSRFDGRCSLRTWVYRVAHNTAISKTVRRRPRGPTTRPTLCRRNHRVIGGERGDQGAPHQAPFDAALS
jgi:RNA polymerase sigma-70 factor (ECF subfamily)